jgi:hypothetical protein
MCSIHEEWVRPLIFQWLTIKEICASKAVASRWSIWVDRNIYQWLSQNAIVRVTWSFGEFYYSSVSASWNMRFQLPQNPASLSQIDPISSFHLTPTHRAEHDVLPYASAAKLAPHLQFATFIKVLEHPPQQRCIPYKPSPLSRAAGAEDRLQCTSTDIVAEDDTWDDADSPMSNKRTRRCDSAAPSALPAACAEAAVLPNNEKGKVEVQLVCNNSRGLLKRAGWPHRMHLSDHAYVCKSETILEQRGSKVIVKYQVLEERHWGLCITVPAGMHALRIVDVQMSLKSMLDLISDDDLVHWIQHVLRWVAPEGCFATFLTILHRYRIAAYMLHPRLARNVANMLIHHTSQQYPITAYSGWVNTTLVHASWQTVFQKADKFLHQFFLKEKLPLPLMHKHGEDETSDGWQERGCSAIWNSILSIFYREETEVPQYIETMRLQQQHANALHAVLRKWNLPRYLPPEFHAYRYLVFSRGGPQQGWEELLLHGSEHNDVHSQNAKICVDAFNVPFNLPQEEVNRYTRAFIAKRQQVFESLMPSTRADYFLWKHTAYFEVCKWSQVRIGFEEYDGSFLDVNERIDKLYIYFKNQWLTHQAVSSFATTMWRAYKRFKRQKLRFSQRSKNWKVSNMCRFLDCHAATCV